MFVDEDIYAHSTGLDCPTNNKMRLERSGLLGGLQPGRRYPATPGAR